MKSSKQLVSPSQQIRQVGLVMLYFSRTCRDRQHHRREKVEDPHLEAHVGTSANGEAVRRAAAGAEATEANGLSVLANLAAGAAARETACIVGDQLTDRQAPSRDPSGRDVQLSSSKHWVQDFFQSVMRGARQGLATNEGKHNRRHKTSPGQRPLSGIGANSRGGDGTSIRAPE